MFLFVFVDHCLSAPQANIIDSQMPSLRTPKKGHNPKSPEDDAQGGGLYIHLPTQHRLRKVRETMYEDPGNPSDAEDSKFSLLPSTNHVQDASDDADNSETWHFVDAEATLPSHRNKQFELSKFSNPFDLVKGRAGSVKSRETWSFFNSDRRPMSVDVGFLPAQKMADQHHVPNCDQIWTNFVPNLQIQHQRGTIFTSDTKRDTGFYDFYDDLLAEYAIEKIGNDTHHTQPIMLPIEL